jgi:hypothetical protein
MGRGRAKAKQTKVARQLKYHTPDTDLGALQRELGTGPSNGDDLNSVDEYGDSYDSYEEESGQRAANGR